MGFGPGLRQAGAVEQLAQMQKLAEALDKVKILNLGGTHLMIGQDCEACIDAWGNLWLDARSTALAWAGYAVTVLMISWLGDLVPVGHPLLVSYCALKQPATPAGPLLHFLLHDSLCFSHLCLHKHMVHTSNATAEAAKLDACSCHTLMAAVD